MTITQMWDKYKDRQHLIGNLPTHEYVTLLLYGLALENQERMKRTLESLERESA